MKKKLYLFILIVLLNSAGGIYFTMYRNSLTVFLLLLFFVYFLINKKTYLFKNSTVVCIFFSIALFINYLFAIDGQTINPYGYLFLVLLIAFFANVTLDKETFLIDFTKALNFYKYHAILTFFAYFVLKNNLIYFEYGNDRSYHTFHYIFFYLLENSTREFYSITYVRNNGLFWEPGILQIFMNLLLFIQLFLIKSTTLQKLSTIFVILTTFSTTGYILMAILLVVKYFSNLTFEKIIKTLPLVFVVSFIFSPLLIYNIQNKTTGKDAASAQGRLFDTLQAVAISRDYPLTGTGLTLEPYAKLQRQFYNPVFGLYSYSPESTTNSVLSTIVFFGVPFGLFILYSLYMQSIFKKQRSLLFLLLVMSLAAEPILLRAFFMFLVLNGMITIFTNLNKKYINGKNLNQFKKPCSNKVYS